MKILHISDTHGRHMELNLVPADVLCFTGDESNSRVPHLNHTEFLAFVAWLATKRHLYKHVIFVAGNHSSFMFHNQKEATEILESIGVIVLNKTSVVIDGLKFYGDPITPTFGDWCYTTSRSKLNKHWELIPVDTDVLLTHGPPLGILDLTENRDYSLQQCGDSALLKRIKKLPNLKAHLFGHIHDFKTCRNAGILQREGITFSNASAVEDGKINLGIKHHGNNIEIWN